MNYFNADLALEKIWLLSHLQLPCLIYYEKRFHNQCTRFYNSAKKYSGKTNTIQFTGNMDIDIGPSFLKEEQLKHPPGDFRQSISVLFLLDDHMTFDKRKEILHYVQRYYQVHFIISHSTTLLKNWVFRGKVSLFNSYNVSPHFTLYENPELNEIHYKLAESSARNPLFPNNSTLIRSLQREVDQAIKNAMLKKRIVSPSKRI